jgi:AhpD family alkylhydroperoxidase
MSHRVDYAKASPEGYRAFGAVHQYINSCGLPPTLIDLVYLRVSQINGCAYCIDKHTRDLIKQGVSVDKVVLVPVWQEAGVLFDDRERAALAWAESVTRVAETGIPDTDYQAVAAHFSEKELADLTYAVALMNAFNRLGVGFRNTPTALARALAAASR